MSRRPSDTLKANQYSLLVDWTDCSRFHRNHSGYRLIATKGWSLYVVDEVDGMMYDSERHRKFVWTAGRVLKEAALWTRVEALEYDDRKFVLKRVAGFLEDLAVRGILQRRSEPLSIGHGDETGYDYVRSPEGKMNSRWVQSP